MYISDATVRKILRDAGAARVSAGAVKELRKHMDRSSFGVAEKAVKLAKHAKRKTVEATDIRLAVE